MSFVDFRILVFRSKEDPYCYRIHQLNSQALSTFAVAATFFQQGQRTTGTIILPRRSRAANGPHFRQKT